MTQFLDHIDTWPKCIAVIGVTIVIGFTISYCFWCYRNTFEDDNEQRDPENERSAR